jgi:hypothetical protein
MNMRKLRIILPLAGIVLCSMMDGAAFRVAAADCSVAPDSLRCEYLPQPLGLDVVHPRLSWKLAASHPDRRGQRQSGYQIMVASNEKLLRNHKADLWDTGDVRSDESVNIVYAGKPLQTGQECFWKVRVADERGVWSDWGKAARWTMGLLDKTDWKAEWIGADSALRADAVRLRKGNPPDPWLRKTFELPARPARAVVYVASVGYHELYVNGNKVGDAVLEPCATDNRVRARYVTYEIGKYLNRGSNVLGLWLGASWSIFPPYHMKDKASASGFDDWERPILPNAEMKDKPWGPIVLAQADMVLTDGRTFRVVTDATWKARPSPNQLLGTWEAGNFGGEEYDARRELPDWCGVKLEDSKWQPVTVVQPDLAVSAEVTRPNRLVKEIKPIAVKQVKEGAYRVDMGVNYSGWFEMRLSGQTGDRIEFEFSERENEAMTFNHHSAYIIGPGGKGTFCNRFNYEGGRWVKIKGLKKKPSLEQMRGWLIRTDYERVGGFECDQPLLNRIYDTTLWTFENLSLGSYLVDCPHRERRGYGGDAHATLWTALDNYDLGAFYTTWAEDWRDVQQPNGDVPYTAPTYQGGGGPVWSGWCITMPWEIHCHYGDTRILWENFPMMQRWLAFLETKSTNNMLARWGGSWDFLGDWAAPDPSGVGDEPRNKVFFNNCYWIYNLETAAKVALALGKPEIATTYRQRAQAVREAVQQTFFNPADDSYANGGQACLGIALMVNLPPGELQPAVWRRLEKQVLVNDKGHIHAGITGGALLMRALMANDRNDLIYTMAAKQDYPSWGDMLQQGATTFYEEWGGNWSRLHSSFLYIGSWFMEGLGGIRHDGVGFKHFIIEPWINSQSGLHHVSAHYDSIYGRIATHWTLKDGIMRLDVTVPPNTDATVRLQDVAADSILEGRQPLRTANGVTLVEGRLNPTVLKLEPGHYEFEAKPGPRQN